MRGFAFTDFSTNTRHGQDFIRNFHNPGKHILNIFLLWSSQTPGAH